MLKKEIEQSTLAQKKFNLVIAVVALLMLLSFIALKINNQNKKESVINVAKLPIATNVPEADEEVEEKRVNVSDIVSAEKLAQAETIKQIVKEDHIIGSTTEQVRLVIYSDFECSYCAQFAETVNQAKKEFGGKLAIVFRHYPLIETHPNSLLAAEASECAADQNKFWDMHDALFALQRKGILDAESISKAATEQNLLKPEFDECLSKNKYKDSILEQVKEAKLATISGSPTAFINGELITGANPYEDGTRSDGSKLEGLKSKILRKLEGR